MFHKKIILYSAVHCTSFSFFVVVVVVLFSNKYNGKVVAGLNVLCSLAREFISECLAPIMIYMNVTSNYKLTNIH